MAMRVMELLRKKNLTLEDLHDVHLHTESQITPRSRCFPDWFSVQPKRPVERSRDDSRCITINTRTCTVVTPFVHRTRYKGSGKPSLLLLCVLICCGRVAEWLSRELEITCGRWIERVTTAASLAMSDKGHKNL
ncbi:hypothetical protein E2C01_002330 [Portunus trituberculatus]|uniref:Uncharacterized protein n=1 Tax=Portunus trituberculatus TaxID=210409 RepID=A0A5B7CLN7_PORTR|nr:hypothetical protein [Portunus trituberculatus]